MSELGIVFNVSGKDVSNTSVLHHLTNPVVFENLSFHLDGLSVEKTLGVDGKPTSIPTAEKLRFKYQLSSFTATKGSDVSFWVLSQEVSLSPAFPGQKLMAVPNACTVMSKETVKTDYIKAFVAILSFRQEGAIT